MLRPYNSPFPPRSERPCHPARRRREGPAFPQVRRTCGTSWPRIMHRGGCLPRLGSARILFALPQRRCAMRPRHTLPIVLLAALGCQAAPPPDTSAEAKQAIDAANATWPRLTAAGHADSLAQYYQANAVILPPNMPAVQGRDSIRAFFAVLNTMSSPPPVLTIRAESVWASGPMAVELGRWHFAWPAAAKRPPACRAAAWRRRARRSASEHWFM